MVRSTVILAVLVAVLVACVLALAIALGIINNEKMRLAKDVEDLKKQISSTTSTPDQTPDQTPDCDVGDLTFDPDISTDNPGVFEDLTTAEINKVVNYLMNSAGLDIKRKRIEGAQSSVIDYMKLAPVDKTDALNHLDNNGPTPDRYAEVSIITFQPAQTEKMATKIYKVGPLGSGSMTATKIQDIPTLSQRMAELDDILKYVYEPFMKRIEPITTESYQAIYNCTGEDESGCIKYKFFTPWVELDGAGKPNKRKSWCFMLRATENEVLYPLGFEIRVDHDITKAPSEWKVDKIFYNFHYFDSVEEFETAYTDNSSIRYVLEQPAEEYPDQFSAITRRSSGSKDVKWKGPQFYQPGGRRYSVKRRHITYMDWAFDVTLNPVTGMSVMDIRFAGDRVVYELSLQEIGAQYSGLTPAGVFTEILDSVYLIGTKLDELVPGIDCPNHAEYMSTVFHDPTSDNNTQTIPNNICIFEWNTATPLKRHSYNFGPARFNGMENSALVVRVVPVLYNYDYVQDVVFYQNGNIEVKVTLDGYVQTGIYNSVYEKEFNPFVRPIHDKVQATLHNHLSHVKVDLDVLGTKNSYKIFEVKRIEDNIFGFGNMPYIQDQITEQEIEREVDAVWYKDFNKPKVHLFYNKDEKNEYGSHRAWEIDVATPGQNLREGSDLQPGFAFSYQQMATTVRKEDELSSSSVYNGPNPYEPVVKFNDFIADNDSIVDQDLVTWITLGKYHITKTEDLPIVTTHGNTLYFTIKPFNYFVEDPSMKSNEHVRIYKETKMSEKEFEDHKTDMSVCAAKDITELMKAYSLRGY